MGNEVSVVRTPWRAMTNHLGHSLGSELSRRGWHCRYRFSSIFVFADLGRVLRMAGNGQRDLPLGVLKVGENEAFCEDLEDAVGADG